MPFLIGLFLIPVVLGIIYKINQVKTIKRTRILLNISILTIALAFIIFCLIVRMAPFDFEDAYATTYMLYRGYHIGWTATIYVFTPFMWIITFHFARMFFWSVRVRINAVIKRKDEYIYYRGDLDKVSPAILAFVSTLEVDLRKSIATTLLKLRHNGYIQKRGSGYICKNQDCAALSESECMVLELIRSNSFDKGRYEKAIEKETIKGKYLTKNRGGIPIRIIKIVIAVCIPIALFFALFRFDNYIFENYWADPQKDGTVYIHLEREEDIERLYSEIEDIDDYYHRTMADGHESYWYNQIRADKLQYSVVRKAWLLAGAVPTSIFAVFIIACISLYRVVEQIIYINKNYRRTSKGKVLLNKAYALKNYLQDYSLIKDRTEQELALWEDYLIYAVALGVNIKIEDEVTEKYIKAVI